MAELLNTMEVNLLTFLQKIYEIKIIEGSFD